MATFLWCLCLDDFCVEALPVQKFLVAGKRGTLALHAVQASLNFRSFWVVQHVFWRMARNSFPPIGSAGFGFVFKCCLF